MKKIILISTIAVAGLFADAMTDAVVSQAKSKATTEVVKQVAGNDVVKKEIANKAIDTVMKDGLSTDALKEQAKEKATDMAAEKASEVVGKETLTKETAKSVIKMTH